MSYTIHCEVNSRLGIVTKVLATDSKWYVATNNPMKFKSASVAALWFFSSDASAVPPVGSVIWIRGPRGGYHPMRWDKS